MSLHADQRLHALAACLVRLMRVPDARGIQGGLDRCRAPVRLLNATPVRAPLAAIADSLGGQAHGRELGNKGVVGGLGDAGKDGLEVVLRGILSHNSARRMLGSPDRQLTRIAESPRTYSCN